MIDHVAFAGEEVVGRYTRALQMRDTAVAKAADKLGELAKF